MTTKRNVGYLWLVASLICVAGWMVELTSEYAKAAEQDSAEAKQVAEQAAGEAKQVVDRVVVARINGQPIYEDQLKAETEKNLGALRRYGMKKDDGSTVKRIQARVLNQAIGDVLINQESKKRTVENIDEKVEQRVKELEEKYGAGEGMERYLKIRKITLDDLRESLKGRVRVDEYLKEQGVLEPEIPESRIREMYDADPKSFSSKESATVSHILIAVDKDAGPEEKDRARQKAEQIRKEILDGKDFAAMAKEHSACRSASEGGNLGRLKKGFMPAEFDTAAYALEPGAVSEVVETKFGFHIIKLVEKDPGGVVPYEQMRDFLKKYLQDEESKNKLESHIAELRKKSEIEILLK
ncbi:MAG: peptidylprolyl isomerase [Pirellulaceae bacterium]